MLIDHYELGIEWGYRCCPCPYIAYSLLGETDSIQLKRINHDVTIGNIECAIKTYRYARGLYSSLKNLNFILRTMGHYVIFLIKGNISKFIL